MWCTKEKDLEAKDYLCTHADHTLIDGIYYFTNQWDIIEAFGSSFFFSFWHIDMHMKNSVLSYYGKKSRILST